MEATVDNGGTWSVIRMRVHLFKTGRAMCWYRKLIVVHHDWLVVNSVVVRAKRLNQMRQSFAVQNDALAVFAETNLSFVDNTDFEWLRFTVGTREDGFLARWSNGTTSLIANKGRSHNEIATFTLQMLVTMNLEDRL